MSDVNTWISSTAFPALGGCWDFFKKCVIDLISFVTGSRLVFIFALFLIGTIISVIVFIVTSTPDVSNADSSYPEFKFHFKRKSEEIIKKNNLPYVTVGGYKFYNPNYKKNNVNKFKAMERNYFRSQKIAPKKRSSNIDVEAD